MKEVDLKIKMEKNRRMSSARECLCSVPFFFCFFFSMIPFPSPNEASRAQLEIRSGEGLIWLLAWCALKRLALASKPGWLDGLFMIIGRWILGCLSQ